MITAGMLGQLALGIAFAAALYGVVAAAVGGLRGRWAIVESARNTQYAVAALVTVASGVLVYALVTHDFSLRYIAEVSTRDAPLAVTLTGFWGGQPGSLLFWAWGLALLGAAAVAREYARHRALMPGTLGTLFAIELFFLGILSFVAGPFERLPVAIQDGQGLNPLLWDDGMRIHPPLLLSGYMSFSVPFAFGIAALLAGRLGREWLGPVRRWMLVAWALQGAGLLAGAWWAYHVLGWGGYWGWDPVENAALLPWLTATAFLHSIMVQERRGMLKVWNLALVIASFALAVFGTFVVRSGVLSSVHSFAQSTVGPYFFAFLGLTLVVALGLLFYRLPQLGSERRFDALASREAGFLLNNLLLVAAAVATFWGTIFPLVSEVTRGTKVSVGAPFFQQVNGPVFLALLALMGLGPLLAWRRTSPVSLWRNLRWPLLGALVVSLGLAALGMRQGLAVLAFAAAAFTLGTIAVEFWRGTRARHVASGEPYPVALARLVGRARRRYGGYLVHLGVVFVAFGVIASTFFQLEEVATLRPGQQLTAGRYTLTYLGLFERLEPGVQVAYARLAVQAGTTYLGEVQPERRVHRNWEQQAVTGVGLRTVVPWLDDVYVLLADWDEQRGVTFRVFVNPLVSLLWAGGGLFVAGTLVAVWPSRVARTARTPELRFRPEAVPGDA